MNKLLLVGPTKSVISKKPISMYPNPAENLVGKTLPNDWKVMTLIPKKKNSTGGNFSVSYIVERDGQTAFLKAQDVSRALRSPNVMRSLEAMATAHNYECDLLKICSENRLTKVVSVLETGEILPDATKGELVTIPYIIFEIAEKTARDHLNEFEYFDNAWLMRSLHNIAVGLKQLHNIGIAHQDVKPSNVLIFDNNTTSKIADLGRSEFRGRQSPVSELNIAGDPAYAAPEHLYNFLSTEWNIRRCACDLYHLGSLAVFYFTETHMTALLKVYLPSEYHWNNWRGSYEEVLPYLKEAFETVMRELSATINKQVEDAKLASKIVTIISQLCEPDPFKRGHPAFNQLKGNRYSLERYITAFDTLATSFEVKLR